MLESHALNIATSRDLSSCSESNSSQISFRFFARRSSLFLQYSELFSLLRLTLYIIDPDESTHITTDFSLLIMQGEAT
jgi:hypothetical protein